MQIFEPPTDFWNNHLKIGDCWEWQGAFHYPNRSPEGYGVIWYAPFQRQMGVHRLAWILHNQQLIPKGIVVMHQCDNTKCYNPKHLIIGTQQDNVEDMLNKKREGIRMRVTHCVHGHEYTPENTQIIHFKNGRIQRRCRTCKRAELKRYRLQKKNML